MKKLSILITILFSMIFTFPSYGSWEFILKHKSGDESYYLDFNSIRKVGDKVFYWTLTNYNVPLEEWKDGQPNGFSKSALKYYEADCNRLGVKTLSVSSFRNEMGDGDLIENLTDLWEMVYLITNKRNYHLTLLNKVCNHIK